MAKFLETIEKIEVAQKESISNIVNKSDGMPMSQIRRMNKKSDQYKKELTEAAKLLQGVMGGSSWAKATFEEAMTTSDFPLLFGDIIDRQILTGYEETPRTWNNYIREGTVPDFRQVKRHYIDGGEGTLDEVGEKGEYKERSISEGDYTYQVAKYGNRFNFSWETMINDDLGAFQDVPAKFGRAARRTEERFATSLFVDADGPHTDLFDAANTIDDNPELSIEALQEAFQLINEQTDEDGEPIVFDKIHLVVPPALEITAQNILNSTQLEITGNLGGGSSDQKLITANWIRNRVELHVNHYIPIIGTAGTVGQDSWFLFGDPQNNRPAAEVGFLQGYRDPQVFMKAPNAMLVGQNNQDPMLGDFESDNIQYKVRHILGGTQMSPKAVVASDGSGS